MQAAADMERRQLSSIKDPRFWEQLEQLKLLLGRKEKEASSQRQLQEVELALETVWARYVSLKKDGLARLQAEVLSLQRRMGEGSDVEGVIDERNDLRVKLKDKEARIEQLTKKVKALEKDQGDVERAQERLSAEVESLQSELRSAKRMRETAEFDLQQTVNAQQDMERELEAVRKELQQERKQLSDVKDSIGGLRGIRIKSLSPVELESLVVKHDKDGSGELSPEELSPFVEELCELMERKMQMAKEDAEREAARAEERERERAREREREREREERLLSQVKELEKELERTQGEHHKHVESLQERSQKQKQHFEEVIESLKAEQEHEVASLKRSFDKTIEYEKASVGVCSESQSVPFSMGGCDELFRAVSDLKGKEERGGEMETRLTMT
eukprot:269404-Hanusia_phi.AAC.1